MKTIGTMMAVTVIYLSLSYDVTSTYCVY